NKCPLSFLITACYYNLARSDTVFFHFPLFLIEARKQVGPLLTGFLYFRKVLLFGNRRDAPRLRAEFLPRWGLKDFAVYEAAVVEILRESWYNTLIVCFLER
ncbi:MAG: hypothetical protein KH216_13170, partial [Clostridiales bacterium]|nr:hypothetical protein [Clostridiales bacterium]